MDYLTNYDKWLNSKIVTDYEKNILKNSEKKEIEDSF